MLKAMYEPNEIINGCIFIQPKQSTCYWPDDMKTDIRRLYGDFSVTLKKREVQQDYIECTLELMDIEVLASYTNMSFLT